MKPKREILPRTRLLVESPVSAGLPETRNPCPRAYALPRGGYIFPTTLFDVLWVHLFLGRTVSEHSRALSDLPVILFWDTRLLGATDQYTYNTPTGPNPISHAIPFFAGIIYKNYSYGCSQKNLESNFSGWTHLKPLGH